MSTGNIEQSSRVSWNNQRRETRVYTHRVAAPPTAVFPLLCPVREHDWIPSWECRMIYSDSGLAEAGCIFATDFGGESIWTVSRYDPPRAIEFVVVRQGLYVHKLEISVEPCDEGRASELCWRRTYTAQSEAGEQALQRQIGAELDAKMDWLGRALDHYCRTGTMLVDGH